MEKLMALMETNETMRRWKEIIILAERSLDEEMEMEEVLQKEIGKLDAPQYIACLQAAHYYLCATDYLTCTWNQEKWPVEKEFDILFFQTMVQFRAEMIGWLETVKHKEHLLPTEVGLMRIAVESYLAYDFAIRDHLENMIQIGKDTYHTYFGVHVSIDARALDVFHQHYDHFVSSEIAR